MTDAPIYIHADIAVPNAIDNYVLPLDHPITIDRRREYRATMRQCFIFADDKMKEIKYPCYLLINDMWKSNNEERHIVRRQVIRRSDMRTFDAACLLPNSDTIMHSNISMLPPSAGVYNHLEFSIRAMNASIIPFKRLIAIIEIRQSKDPQ